MGSFFFFLEAAMCGGKNKDLVLEHLGSYSGSETHMLSDFRNIT